MNSPITSVRPPAGLVNRSAVFQITGFDRLNFVNEITQAVPQNDHCRIVSMSFEVMGGVRVMGSLTVDVPDRLHRDAIGQQLRAIRGVVSINELN